METHGGVPDLNGHGGRHHGVSATGAIQLSPEAGWIASRVLTRAEFGCCMNTLHRTGKAEGFPTPSSVIRSIPAA